MGKRLKRDRLPGWPRGTVATALALLGLLFLVPLFLLPEEEPAPRPTATLPAVAEPTPEPEATASPGWDKSHTLRVLMPDGAVETMTMADYLWGVVAAEMPASFQIEALKAQAVCARTYSLYQREGAEDKRDQNGDGKQNNDRDGKHPGADVCTDYTCCQAYLTPDQAAGRWGSEADRYADKVREAVSATDGLCCLYEGKPIDAVFFSSSAGRTSDAAAVWGADVPYLASVASPEGEEVPGWQTIVTMPVEEFLVRFQGAYPQADFGGDPAGWFSGLETDPSGLVTGVTIGGVRVSGGRARSVFGLRSAHFTAAATEEGVTFWVTGYGHGVGLSQYGANALASQGKSFEEILKWYYTGITVGTP